MVQPGSSQGGLRLDLREVLGDGASDPVVIPGDPQNSLLLQRIRPSILMRLCLLKRYTNH